jgi:ankyrin repeat protein
MAFLEIDHAELWCFSRLHKVVLGILHLNLEMELRDPGIASLIDSYDLHGKTPLHWAAARGDVRATEHLLRAGAARVLEKRDNDGKTALHLAVATHNVRCVEVLLMAGANVHARDSRGDDAFLIAVYSQDETAVLEALLLGGSSLDSRNSGNTSALQSAAAQNWTKICAYLLEKGADIDSFDDNGDTPLFETIYYNCYGPLSLLLGQSINLGHTNRYGWTALHVAALYGDEKTLQMLASARLVGIDSEAKDLKGRTAKEAFKTRHESPNELKMGFENLLTSIEDVEKAVEDEDCETFVDALEVQQVSE